MPSNPLQDLMRHGESGIRDYDAYNRGTHWDPQRQRNVLVGADRPIDFSRLTLGQVMDMQALPNRAPNRLFAVGKYQVIPATLEGAVRTLRLDRNQPFNREMQDRIFSEYLIRDKRAPVRDYLEGRRGAALESAQYALSQEWASFPDPTRSGASHYGKDGVNKAHISLQQSANALNTMRTSYREAIDQGKSPKEAWTAMVAGEDRTRSTVSGPGSERGNAPGFQSVMDMILPPQGGIVPPRADAGLTGRQAIELQDALNKLGYAGSNGKPLETRSGIFGPQSNHALRAFQSAHDLKVDGIVGPKTQDALKRSKDHPLINEAGHPSHGMYEQIKKQTDKLGGAKALGFHNDGEYVRALANMTWQARIFGLTQVDHVLENANKQNLVMIQGELGDPAQQREVANKAQAAQQTLEQSTRQLQEDAVQLQQQAHGQQQLSPMR